MKLQMNWSLDELYPSFRSDSFQKDFEGFQKAVWELVDWAEKNLRDDGVSVHSGESEHLESGCSAKIEAYIRMQNDFSRYYKLLEYAQLVLSVDTMNEEAAKWMDVLEELLAELKAPEVRFKHFIKALPDLEAVIAGSALLQEHRFLLQDVAMNASFLLSREEEVAIAKMRNTGSLAWEKLMEQLTGTLLVDLTIDGEQKSLPLSVVRNNAYDADSVLRRLSYEGELRAYEKIEKPVAFALNSIKGEVLAASKMRGYASPLDMTLRESRMDWDVLDALLCAIREGLPAFRRYFLRKAAILGHTKGLPFYDLFAPVGRSELTFTYEEAAEFIIGHFSDFSPGLGDFAKKAFEGAWIDVPPREGKRGGAFCSNIHPLGQSRIMANFTGSFNDVLTLAHELGHGFHGDRLMGESYLNSHYPMPIAETASTLCETIVVRKAYQLAGKEEALGILENDISGAAQVIVDIYSRFLFEDRVFQRRKEGALSVQELKALMEEAQQEAYGEGLDSDFLHPYMWVCKPHYYDALFNYYNFPYAYGLLFAKGLYALYEKDQAYFVRQYDELLKATGKNNLRDVAKICGVDVGEPAFWRSSLEIVEKDIEEFDRIASSINTHSF